MTRRFRGDYSGDWPAIALAVKERAGWRCERCREPHDPETGHVLTVHHLDGDKSNNADWNLAALCQRCHLRIQGRVDWYQAYMFEHTPWMEPHVAAFLAAHDSYAKADRADKTGD